MTSPSAEAVLRAAGLVRAFHDADDAHLAAVWEAQGPDAAPLLFASMVAMLDRLLECAAEFPTPDGRPGTYEGWLAEVQRVVATAVINIEAAQTLPPAAPAATALEGEI